MKKVVKNKKKSFLDIIKTDFKKMILGNMILTCLFLIFGVIIYLHPVYTMKAVGIFIGIYFILAGILAIYEYILRKDNPLFSLKIFMGILVIILGLFTMFNPFDMLKVLTIALGIYLSIMAIINIIDALKLKKYGFDGWLVLLVGGIIELILGVFIGINPMASVDIVEVTGIFIVLGSILDLVNLFMFYSKYQDIMKLFKK